MGNTVCSFLLGGNISESSSLLGLRALWPYYRSFFSGDVWLAVVVRAPRHMLRRVPGAPMMRSHLHHREVGQGVVLYALSSLVNCILPRTLVYMV